MIGIILHKKEYSGALIRKVTDNSISRKYIFCNNKSKQESLFKSKIGECVSNSNQYNSQVIFKLFKDYRYGLVNKLKLEFSFGLFDNKNQIFFGARDRMGVKPFYYYDSDELFIYSSDIKFIKEQLNIFNLDKQWIISTLTGTVLDKTTSQLEGVKKLAPAYYLIMKSGKVSITKYWDLQKQNLPSLSDKDYIQQLRTRLVAAVENRMLNIIGTELSGGLDSSAIAGIMAQNGKKLHSYSHTLANVHHNKIMPYKDERDYRDLVCNKYSNIKSCNIDSINKGLFYELQDEIKRQGIPVSNTLAYFSDGIYDKATEDGVDTLFSGFGGDEGISNYATILPIQYARKLKLSTLKETINKPYFSKSFFSKIVQANLSLFINKNENWRLVAYNMLYVKNEFAELTDMENMYWKYHGNRTVNTLDEFIFQKLSENYISNRTEATGASARARSIEYTFPLLDVDLIEYYYSLPERLKYKNGLGRYAFRKIIKGFVPDEIYRRTGKMGATVPNVLVRFMKDYKIIEEFLQTVRKGKASEYINFDKMIANMTIIKQYSEGKMNRTNQHIFFNALMLVLYIENEY